MKHRHLNTTTWTPAAIDSALERGDLADWRELFEAVRASQTLAGEVLRVARSHYVEGSSRAAEVLVLSLWPGLKDDRSAA